MTIIKYFDNTPHIVRFGTTNDNPGKTEVQLWRNGKHFVLTVDQADVQGTEFERQWIPLLNPESMESFASCWSQLCDLVISNCLEVLQRLAPHTSAYWSTLYDYLHVDSYTLKLQCRASGSGSDVDVVVHDGPTSTSAYEMQPTAWNTFNIPDDLPIFESQHVIPLNHKQDPKGPPKKVRLPDGKVAFFLRCETSRRHIVDGTTSNDSHRSIAAHLSLHSLQIPRNDTYARIPNVLGVLSDRHSSVANGQQQEETKMAGLFLEWIEGFRLINVGLYPDILYNSGSRHKKWKEQVTALIEEMHRISPSLEANINPYCMIIDRNDGHTWMTKFHVNEEARQDEYREMTEPTDSERSRLRLVYDQWLKSEEEEVSRLSAASDQQEIRKAAVGRWYAIVNSQS